MIRHQLRDEADHVKKGGQVWGGRATGSHGHEGGGQRAGRVMGNTAPLSTACILGGKNRACHPRDQFGVTMKLSILDGAVLGSHGTWGMLGCCYAFIAMCLADALMTGALQPPHLRTIRGSPP